MAVPAMTAVHEDVQQRTRQQNQPRQGGEDMCLVLGQ
jgi:hypothetical protein